MLTNETLSVMNPDQMPETVNIRDDESGIRGDLFLFVHGGLSFIDEYKVDGGQIVFDGRMWKYVGTNTEYHVTIKFTGRWDALLQRGFVESIRALHNDSVAGFSYVLEDYKYDETLARYIPNIVTTLDPYGSIEEQLVYLGAEKEELGRFEEMTRLPDLSGTDPVRGPVTVNHFTDYRDASKIVFRVRDESPEGWTQVSVPMSVDKVGRLTWIRWVGIGGSSIVLIIIAFLRLRMTALFRGSE